MLEQTMTQFSALASKLLVADAQQLRQICLEHDELVAQVTKDDSIIRDTILRLVPYLFDTVYRLILDSALHHLVDQPLRQRPHFRLQAYMLCTWIPWAP